MAKNRGVYLDLFDDGIPGRNLLAEDVHGDSLEERLVHTAKFQILVAILFGESIIVPEPWIISSPTFLNVADEIQDHYRKYVRKSDAIGKRKHLTPPVFVFTFLDDADRPLTSKYLNAFANRLEQNRRIQCLSGFMDDTDPKNSQRHALASFMRSWIDQIEANLGTIDSFEEKLSERLSSWMPDRRDGGYRVSSAIANVMRYLQTIRNKDISVPWGPGSESRYRHHLQFQVELVRNAVTHSQDLLAHHGDEMDIFRAFFEEAEHKKIPLSDVMAMARLLVNYPDFMKEKISAFGRYVLNRGLAHGAGSYFSCLSFDFYARGKTTQFDRALMEKVLTNERKAKWADFPTFMQLAHGREYDLAKSIDWPATWQSCADVLNDPGWARRREKIVERLMKHNESEQQQVELWQELFDRVNGSFHDIQFRITGNYPSIIDVTRKALSTIKDNASEGTIQAVTSLSEDTAKLASMSAPAATALISAGLKHIPYYRILRFLRHSQHARKSGLKLQRSAANLLRF